MSGCPDCDFGHEPEDADEMVTVAQMSGDPAAEWGQHLLTLPPGETAGIVVRSKSGKEVTFTITCEEVGTLCGVCGERIPEDEPPDNLALDDGYQLTHRYCLDEAER